MSVEDLHNVSPRHVHVSLEDLLNKPNVDRIVFVYVIVAWNTIEE